MPKYYKNACFDNLKQSLKADLEKINKGYEEIKNKNGNLNWAQKRTHKELTQLINEIIACIDRGSVFDLKRVVGLLKNNLGNSVYLSEASNTFYTYAKECEKFINDIGNRNLTARTPAERIGNEISLLFGNNSLKIPSSELEESSVVDLEYCSVKQEPAQ